MNKYTGRRVTKQAMQSEQVHGPESDKTGNADRVNRYTGRRVTGNADSY